jgi:hypothetical protein
MKCPAVNFSAMNCSASVHLLVCSLFIGQFGTYKVEISNEASLVSRNVGTELRIRELGVQKSSQDQSSKTFYTNTFARRYICLKDIYPETFAGKTYAR